MGQPGRTGAGTASVDDRVLLDAAMRAAHAAAEVIRARAGDLRTLTWEEKSPTDFVSAVDRAAEQRIGDVLGSLVPDAQLIGEEQSPDMSVDMRGLVFVADPLDGTTNFLHGYPEYAVSIAALVDGELRAGVVLNAAHGELFAAVAGGGATRNGAPISVSALTTPSRALVGTGFPFKHPELIEPYLRQLPAVMSATAGVRRAGAAALDLANVACGRFDAFWELMLAPWDVAAGILLVREAGGIATDLAGRPSPVAYGGLVAGNRPMHAWLLAHLTSTRTEAST